MWAMFSAPLLAGNDVSNMTADTKEILLNKEVIAIDQDRARGSRGGRVKKTGNLEVWSKQLQDGGRELSDYLLIQRHPRRLLVTSMHFIGLDIHKKTISYCVKEVSGTVLSEGTVAATRVQLDDWVKTLPTPWTVAMEATMFTGWIYDHLLPHAAAVKVAHRLMLRAIAAAKKKNDRVDASKICDCLRCDFLPECHMVSAEVRERRRTLRYRKLLVRQNVQLRNKVSQMLMESGVVYNKQKLHKVGYFKELMETNPDISRELKPLLAICRETIVRIGKTESALIRSLRRDPLLHARVERLMTIPAVGPITALTWVLEVDDVARFHSVKQAVSYCGLCGAERSSAETIKRMPISKQRNKHLQSVLIEAAKLAPRLSPELALVYDTEKQKGHANRASIAVARKLVAYLLAVDRSGREFVVAGERRAAA